MSYNSPSKADIRKYTSCGYHCHARCTIKVPEVYSIGDGREPHRIIHAVHDGSHVGRIILMNRSYLLI